MILIFDIFLYKDFLKNVSNVVSTSDLSRLISIFLTQSVLKFSVAHPPHQEYKQLYL